MANIIMPKQLNISLISRNGVIKSVNEIIGIQIVLEKRHISLQNEPKEIEAKTLTFSYKGVSLCGCAKIVHI